MNRQFRHPNGKAKKWVESRYAKPYLTRQFLKRAMLHGVVQQGLSQIHAINRSQLPSVTKAAQVATAIETLTTSTRLCANHFDEYTSRGKQLNA